MHTATIVLRTRYGRGVFAVPYLGTIVREKPVTIKLSSKHPQYSKIIDAILRGAEAKVLELLSFDQVCGA